MKTLFVLLLPFWLGASQITVAVAANLSDTIHDLVALFHASHPNVRVRTIIGSSGKLTAQILHGAPYGLFLSADTDYPKALERRGFALSKPRVYARGTLALLLPHGPAPTKGLTTLLDPSVHRIAIANPHTAPYGKASQEALEKTKLWEKIRDKIVFAESVGQTLTYTLKAADAGLVAVSALHSTRLRHFEEGKRWIRIDPTLYTPIDQAAVLLKKSEGRADYRTFYEFLFSTRAAKIFQRYGYLTP